MMKIVKKLNKTHLITCCQLAKLQQLCFSVSLEIFSVIRSIFCYGFVWLYLTIPFQAQAQAQAQANQDDYVNTIIVASHIEPPFVYIENDNFLGSNVEVAKLLAERVGKKVKFVYCPFARCLSMTRNGSADMMVAINKTTERMEYLEYLAQPFSSKITPVLFYVKSGSQINISNYEDLKGLSIGVLRGATYFEQFNKDSTLNKIEVTTHQQLIEMLLKGRIDTFLGRALSIKERVSEDVYEHDFHPSSYVYTKPHDSYIAISKKSAKWLDAQLLSDALDKLLADGSIAAITDR